MHIGNLKAQRKKKKQNKTLSIRNIKMITGDFFSFKESVLKILQLVCITFDMGKQ